MTKLRFTMTKRRARELGLIFCTCGHPQNNHFSWGKKTCARCDCKGLDETLSRQNVKVEMVR